MQQNVPSRQIEAADQGVIILTVTLVQRFILSFFENVKQLLNSTIFAFCESPDTLSDISKLYS
jgi:energy-coupling factor transporter transmembrane protein EcfT